MANNNTNSYYDNGIASMLMADYVNAKNLEASRPMKASTTTTATKMPVEYQDMLKRRNQIGTATQTLNDILKQRETPLYGLGSLMAQMPEQSGPGSWLGSLARGLGGGLTFGTNAAIDRAQRNYENAQNDLQTALAFDRDMGDTQTETQTNKYEPVSQIGNNNTDNAPRVTQTLGKNIISQGLGKYKLDELNKTAGRFETNAYDPSDKTQGWWTRQNVASMRGKDYGLRLSRGDPNAKAFQLFETSAMDAAFEVLKALRPATDQDVLLSLRTVGADPTLFPEVRDQRVTKILNQELAKSGFKPVANLAEWDKFVESLMSPSQQPQTGMAAEQQALFNSANNTLEQTGGVLTPSINTDGWRTTKSGVKYRIKQ